MGLEASGKGHQSKQLKILIVDDCPVVRDGLGSLLKGSPFIKVVGEAASGRDALDDIEALRPDVVLVDAQMPGLDGVETTRRIKMRWPQVKVLFLAVHPSYIESGLAAGADGHLLKDCTPQELTNAIRAVAGENLRHCA